MFVTFLVKPYFQQELGKQITKLVICCCSDKHFKGNIGLDKQNF